MTVERWASVPGYEGRYIVSDLGNVRSCDRLVPVPGQVSRRRKGQALKGSRADKTHYRSVTLAGRSFSVHTLVLLAFRGRPAPGQEARHLNGKKSDCRLENLEWATHKTNEQDKVRHGTQIRGSSHKNTKISPEQVIELRRMVTLAGTSPSGKVRRYTFPRLAALFGISPKYAQSIAAGLDRADQLEGEA